MNYRELTPRIDAIKKALEVLPTGSAVFLAALVSCCNGDTGGRMLRALQASGFADIASRLDVDQRRVLADLLVSFEGW
jgi:hypothetical protein